MATSRRHQHTLGDDAGTPLRPLMLLARAGALGFILLLLVLHFVSPGFDPMSRFVSEYVLGDYPWLMRLAFLSVTLALLAMTLLVHRALPPSRRRTVVTGLFGVTAVATLVAGAFDTDSKDVFTEEPSTSGLIHYWAFMISVLALLTGVFVLWRLFAQTPAWRVHARSQLLFASAMLATFLLMLTSVAIVGLAQRVYLLVSLGWLVVASGWLGRADVPARRREEAAARVTSP
jgi:hypothetical protein